MKWRDRIQDYDDDTITVVNISIDMLVRYFGHTMSTAEDTMDRFFADYGEYYDEDFIHHESAYRFAAIAHYLSNLNGSRERVGEWLQDSGHAHSPGEANDYFWKKYYDSNGETT